ncbi:MAG: NAD(P)/FAD-dependent oxidoreductase, partial [Thermoproteota archaeon]|nr:NAD(P)/FAD-dependent oxidoreductase [Thermoproteota archaeon]
GEGIIPSTRCAELLVQNLHNMTAYRHAVLEKFKIYSLVFKFIKLKITGRFNMIKHGMDMLKLYRHMKSEEERYGMNIKMSDMLKVSGI